MGHAFFAAVIYSTMVLRVLFCFKAKKIAACGDSPEVE